jgi:molybdate transport system regulatory protein
MPDHTLLDGDLRLGGRLDARFFALLEAIGATGSITRAARTAGYSYRGAWLLLETASNLATRPLLETHAGGRQGGGSQLTPAAHALLAAWRQLQRAHREFLQTQEAWLLQQPELALALRRLALKTTARNQFAGTIAAIAPGPVSTQVTLALPGGPRIVAMLASEAAGRLGLHEGGDAIALVKASAVVLVADFAGHRLSASNQLAGTISRVDRGAVSTLIGLTLPGGAVITATVTNDAVEALGLAVGQPAHAVFKAAAVMLAVAEPTT